MADNFVAFVEGIESIADAHDWSEDIKRAIYQSMNRAADRTRTSSAAQMRKEVNFGASYLAPSQGRFTVSRRASPNKLEAVIRGRDRPTSLARFATSGKVNKPGVRVEVTPGSPVFMKNAFLVRLPAGKDVQTKGNMGLAVRLGPGKSFKNKKQAIQMKNGLYLLYGPSVNQVFQSVREDQKDPALDYWQAEFERMVRDL